MITVTFIGSDKNAGKTTAFNHMYGALYEKTKSVCLTSTGISGDRIDAFYGHPKPDILIRKNSYFITATERLSDKKKDYSPIIELKAPDFSKSYMFGKSIRNFKLVLEGPNTKKELLLMKDVIRTNMEKTILMIDGSADRQFVAHPAISDGFCFSILISENPRSMERTRAFLVPFSLSACPVCIRKPIILNLEDGKRSLLLDENFQEVYAGRTVPFQDKALYSHLKKRKHRKTVLYINGALSPSLFSYLRSYDRLTVVLDNFTLYQTIPTESHSSRFHPALHLLHKAHINGIFIRDTTPTGDKRHSVHIPQGIPVCDLFRDTAKTIQKMMTPLTGNLIKHCKGSDRHGPVAH
ncbi:MAG: hypothetical protein KJ737_02500 [Proteobacteria bacterium]|nr:hypothetical protein [Pseudomonadota bacterium]